LARKSGPTISSLVFQGFYFHLDSIAKLARSNTLFLYNPQYHHHNPTLFAPSQTKIYFNNILLSVLQ